MPLWMMIAFFSLVAGRSVRAYIAGRLGTQRQLLCGTGMGGPASMFVWNIAYDPVIVGTSDAAKAPCPTCSGDLNGHVVGPGQAHLPS